MDYSSLGAICVFGFAFEKHKNVKLELCSIPVFEEDPKISFSRELDSNKSILLI